MSLEAIISSALLSIDPDRLEDAIITNDMLVNENVVRTMITYLKPQTDIFLSKLTSVLDKTDTMSVLEFLAYQNYDAYCSIEILAEHGLDIATYFDKLIQTYKDLISELVNVIRVKRNEKK